MSTISERQHQVKQQADRIEGRLFRPVDYDYDKSKCDLQETFLDYLRPE